MQFFPTQRLTIEVEVSSGKKDSFDDLQDLLFRKQTLTNDIAQEFASQLGKNAEQKLHSTKDTYISAITIENGEVVLDTSQFLVAMVEDGVPSFDMKPGLLASPKVKVSKNGQRYLVVPLSTFKNGKYNWRDRESGQFKAGTSGVKGTEFRVVSDSSPSNSWIHPGHPGFHFIDETLEDFDNGMMDMFIDDKVNAIIEKI
jgi:hypothetical protein